MPGLEDWCTVSEHFDTPQIQLRDVPSDLDRVSGFQQSDTNGQQYIFEVLPSPCSRVYLFVLQSAQSHHNHKNKTLKDWAEWEELNFSLCVL
jgi:hypothetical protein